MSNVAGILEARWDRNFDAFSERLDEIWRSTIANVDRNDPRVSNVLDALFDTLASKAETQENLIEKLTTASDEESAAIQDQLDAGPHRAMETFIEKVKSTSDLEDPVALSAFEAAGQYLVQFLQLENECMCNSLDMFITHVQLKSDRQPRRPRRHSRAKQKSPQGADGKR
jgi:hypothetical protein